MKKLVLGVAFIASVALTACDKKPSTNAETDQKSAVTQPSISLSTNNTADIKSDLTQIQNLSTNKAKEALKFQSEVLQATQKNDKSALQSIVSKIKTYTEGFNQELDALSLKSSEADAVRTKMKEGNNLSLELSEAGLNNPPDVNKINELQKKITELQQTLLNDMQNLQTKANAAK